MRIARYLPPLDISSVLQRWLSKVDKTLVYSSKLLKHVERIYAGTYGIPGLRSFRQRPAR